MTHRNYDAVPQEPAAASTQRPTKATVQPEGSITITQGILHRLDGLPTEGPTCRAVGSRARPVSQLETKRAGS